MTSVSTELKNIKKLQDSVFGQWVKVSYYYSMQCFTFDTWQQYGEEASYFLSVEKHDGLYVVYAEEHEPYDIPEQGKGFKTLSEAKKFAEDFAQHFESCWLDNVKEECLAA